MASFKSNPVYYTSLGLLGVAALAAGWAVYDRHEAANKSEARLQAKQNEVRSIQAVRPAPTEASKAAIEADLRRTEAALSAMRDQLRVRGAVADALRNTQPPGGSTEVFFNLETFVERMRRKAADAGIKLKAGERFGFYTYTSTGPERDLIPAVFRQRQVAEYLLNALMDAKPSELVAFHRERPLTKAQREMLAAGQTLQAPAQNSGNNPGATDFFEIDRRISARVPGFVDATAFRLTFVGETSTLRALLNKLAEFELPLVVRSVEVEPAARPAPAPAAPPANSLSAIFGTPAPATPPEEVKPKPLVERIPSTFTVTVELIDLVEAPATEASTTP